jgi:hypothetical protein
MKYTFISDKNGVSRADMQDYLRQGIAAVVDEEFNKELTASSLEALLSARSRNGDFSGTVVNEVRVHSWLDFQVYGKGTLRNESIGYFPQNFRNRCVFNFSMPWNGNFLSGILMYKISCFAL